MFRKIHVFRVKPRQELLSEITRYCKEQQIRSGVVIGLIGSVESAKLNYLKALPGKYETEAYTGPLEIVCAQGSVAIKDEDLIVVLAGSFGPSQGASYIEISSAGNFKKKCGTSRVAEI